MKSVVSIYWAEVENWVRFGFLAILLLPGYVLSNVEGSLSGALKFFSNLLVIFFQEEVRKDSMEIDGSMLAKRAR